MHSMFIFGALLHATALAVIGFFVLFAADRAAGRVQTIGKLLGLWLFILAALALVGAVLALGTGRVPGGGSGWMGDHHRGMMGSYPQGWTPPGPAAAQNDVAPANIEAAPAAAPAAK
jgi:hypothetical protein